MKDPRDIIIKPVVSEKSYAAYDLNVYTFVVAPDANKIEIRKAVEELFARSSWVSLRQPIDRTAASEARHIICTMEA